MRLFKKKKKEQTTELAIKDHGENPYLNGRQEWYERYGSYIKQRDGWRLFAIIGWCVASLFMGFCGYLGTQSKIIPYIVEVDKLGRANAVDVVDETRRTNMKNVIPSVISMCVTDWRTVTADVELQKRMIKRLGYFTTGAAKGYFREWYNLNNPYEIGKENLINVELKSLPLAITENSYKVEWAELIRNHAGKVVDTVRYEATVTIKLSSPTSEEMVLNNPTGIFITHINATKLF